jgi:hypothetical protein
MALTYDPIATTTISGSSTNTYTFSSIPSTYTDLVLVFGNFQGTTNYSFAIRFNGDSGSNYSYTVLEGNGSASASTGNSRSTTGYYNGAVIGFPDSKSNGLFNIMNYSNATTYKSILGRYNYRGTGLSGMGISVGTWRSTSAITSLTFFLASGNFTAGSTATLYGIKAA